MDNNFDVNVCFGRTFRKNCPAMLLFRASQDGTLVLLRVNEDHNHEVSKVSSHYVLLHGHSN